MQVAVKIIIILIILFIIDNSITIPKHQLYHNECKTTSTMKIEGITIYSSYMFSIVTYSAYVPVYD